MLFFITIDKVFCSYLRLNHHFHSKRQLKFQFSLTLRIGKLFFAINFCCCCCCNKLIFLIECLSVNSAANIFATGEFMITECSVPWNLWQNEIYTDFKWKKKTGQKLNINNSCIPMGSFADRSKNISSNNNKNTRSRLQR